MNLEENLSLERFVYFDGRAIRELPHSTTLHFYFSFPFSDEKTVPTFHRTHLVLRSLGSSEHVSLGFTFE